MTDTARTVAALKTLLADNTAGDISAQDMRDVLESIANPVPGGGLAGGVLYPSDAAFMFHATDGTMTVQTAQQVYLDFTDSGTWTTIQTYDPLGLASTVGSYPGVRLPTGIWWLWSVTWWASGGTAAGQIFSYPFEIDDQARTDADPILGSPFFTNVLEDQAGSGISATADLQHINATAMVPVSPAVIAVDSTNSNPGQGFGLGLFLYQTTGNDRAVVDAYWGGIKLANIYGDGTP